MRILYLGWHYTGNIGDEVLFECFQDEILDIRSSTDVRVDSYNPQRFRFAVNFDKYDAVVLGGGSLFCLEDYLDALVQACVLEIPIYTWGTGMDRLPFALIEHLLTYEHAVKLKTDWPLIGKLSSMGKFMKNISVRGPLTEKFLRSIGYEGDICVVGDPAIHTKPFWYRDRALPIVTDRPTVAINVGAMANPLWYGEQNRTLTILYNVIEHLAKQNLHVCLYAVFFTELQMVKSLCTTANQQGYMNVSCINEIYDASALTFFLSKCWLSINTKLHANIFSVAAGTPTIMLGYGFKTFDFAYSMGLNDMVVSTGDTNLQEKIFDLVGQRDLLWKRVKESSSLVAGFKRSLINATNRIVNS